MGLLDGKLAMITGAGRGLGAAMARGFAEAGAGVIIVDRDADAAANMAAELQATGAESWGYALDVSDRKAVAAFAEQIAADHGRLNTLANNAGIAPRVSLGDAGLVEAWDNTININLTAQFDMTCAFIPLLKQSRGNVIYTASISAFIAPGSSPGYGAAKAGIVSLTKYMARELGKDGVRVNAIAPGIMLTEMSAGRQGDKLNRVPLGRNGNPEEVAGPVVFLASDMASYVTGVTLPVDGGFMAV
ncbi:SDR family NAD(P)-dependent oxidoreductase [Devosia sp. A449]